MIEAVVFDMDGLLVDSEPLWDRARIAACGADRLQWTAEDQQRIMGTSTQEWGAFMAARLDYELTPDEIIEKVVAQMEAFYNVHVPVLPGAHDVLKRLSRQYPLGLASGSSYRLIRAVLRNTGWADLFQYVLSADDMTQGKPAPDIYIAIMRQMGATPHATAIFEDSANGILAGYTAGGKVIAVPSNDHRPPDDALSKAARVLDSLTEFTPDILADL